MKTVGLCMIVKNESRVIERCLDSVRPLVDYVLVDDTGSTDGTQQIIRDWLDRHSIPGEVVDEPWQDFAHNRSIALARLRRRQDIDYALIMDADDVLVPDDGFDPAGFKAGLTADLYHVTIQLGPVRYHRPHLCRNRLEYHYRGVVHEFLEGPEGAASADAQGLTINAGVEGARSQDQDKYRKDADALACALETEQDPLLRARYTFYLGQSWRDCGEHEKALAAYLERAGMGFWDEEVFISLYNAAQLKEKLNHPGYEVIGMHMRAFEACPRRAESLHAAARYCRATGKNHQGHMLAKQGLDIPQPSGGLFVEPWVWEYGLLDEVAVNGYWAGKYQDCLTACDRLLAEGKMPEGMRERVEMNANFAREKLPARVAPDQTDAPPIINRFFIRDRTPELPRVLIAILAKQKEPVLPFYLMCIEALDYPKHRIVLYVRTNNNTDKTADILTSWLGRIGREYERVIFDARNVEEKVENYGVHEWNAERFSVLGRIRQASLKCAIEQDVDFYFVADVDNFLAPFTLRDLVELDRPLVAPFLRYVDQSSMYSNFHHKIDQNGYFLNSEEYNWIWSQRIRGLIDVPVVHCTYLIRKDAIAKLAYDDGSGRYEYVIFSDTARRAGIPQLLDNRKIYGYVTMAESTVGAAELMGPLLAPQLRKVRAQEIRLHRQRPTRPPPRVGIGAPVFIHSSWRTGSTWFWSRFRELPNTLCYYEPFHAQLEETTISMALGPDPTSWDSRHPPDAPYLLEYLPLIRRSVGVPFYRSAMALDSFIPEGGLRGNLRPEERDYIGYLLRTAVASGRVPVFGFCRSLGRVHPIKEIFGGVNILLRRNLWHQWLSFVGYKNRGNSYFYDTVAYLAKRTDDVFLYELANHYLPPGLSEACWLETRRVEALLNLSEPEYFELFIGVQIYFLLNALLTTDVDVDLTSLGRDGGYQRQIEQALREKTGLPISLSSVRDDTAHLSGDIGMVDWDRVRHSAQAAARALADFAQGRDACAMADELIEVTCTEAQCKKVRTASGLHSSRHESETAQSKCARPPVCPDEIHVINLDRSIGRMNRFRERNSHINCVRVSAYDGSTVDIGHAVEQGIIGPGLGYRPGAIGCALSHVDLWRQAIETGQPLTIAEDDAVLSHSFMPKARDLLRLLEEDWDIVTWSYGFRTFVWLDILPGISAIEVRPSVDKLGDSLDSFQKLNTEPMLLKLLHQFGLICYSISPRGAETMLSRCLPLQKGLIRFRDFPIVIQNDGIDCVMNEVYPDIKAFSCFPPLAVLDPALPSTIR